LSPRSRIAVSIPSDLSICQWLHLAALNGRFGLRGMLDQNGIWPDKTLTRQNLNGLTVQNRTSVGGIFANKAKEGCINPNRKWGKKWVNCQSRRNLSLISVRC
jgi:hypothetical protein